MNWNRVLYDFHYIILNRIINQIPSWRIRRYFYVNFGMRIEEEARIGIGTVILNPKGIHIGKRSVINENCYLDGRGKLQIGHDTSISAYTKILSASHKENSGEFRYFENRTVIGNYVWIGTGAIILDGSRIKNYAVVGAGSVLKGTIKENEVAVGNPAKSIKKRNLASPYHLKYKAYFR